MSVFLWKTHDFLKSCSNLWCSFGRQLIFIYYYYYWNFEVSYEKQIICLDSCSTFQFPCEWFRFAFQRRWTSINMTPWSQLAPKVHLRRKVKYSKCHFLSALHFPEIQGSRSETFRLHRFSFTSDSLSPNSLQGVAMLTWIYTKGFHGLQATSCRLQARGGRLQATGKRLQARSNSKPGATSSRQKATGRATGYKHHVLGWTPRPFRYVGGLTESSDFHLHLLPRCCALKLFFKHVG